MSDDNDFLSKSELRKLFIEKRKSIRDMEREIASQKFYDNFLKNMTIKDSLVIAGFSPVNGEIDVIPLLKELRRRGHICVMPHTIDTETPLEFVEWYDGIEMSIGKYNIPEPKNDKKYIPDIILAPFVAFNGNRSRVGYGAGLYDRTVSYIKEKNLPVFMIGVGYELQKVDNIPIDKTDVAMDMVITDKNVYI